MDPTSEKPNMPGAPDRMSQEPEYDAGIQSLATALRISFIVLAVVMVLLFFGYLASGFYTVEPQWKAIQLHFGAKSGEPRGPGIHWAWPFPIDEVVKINATQNQTVEVNTFWYQSGSQSEAELRQEREELRKEIKAEKVKGAGGYNLTGDLNIINTYWVVTYNIEDPVAYLRTIRMNSLMDERPLIRNIVEQAVIQAIGHMGVYDALYVKSNEAAIEIARLARRELGPDGLNTGVLISNVLNSPSASVPPPVVDAFLNATAARQDMKRDMENAYTFRTATLGTTAGAVGNDSGDLQDPRGLGDLFTEFDAAQEDLHQTDAKITDVRSALDAANAKLASATTEQRPALEAQIADLKQQAASLEALKTEIDTKLAALPIRIGQVYKNAGADVLSTRAEADNYCRNVVANAIGDASAIRSLLAKFPNDPEKLSTYLNHYRLDVLAEVLSKVDDKYLLPATVDGTKSRLDIGLTPPPELLQQKRKIEETR